MYLVGVTLCSLKYLRKLPKFVDAPDTSILKLLLLMYTLDICYTHQSLTFAIRAGKAAAKVCLQIPQIQGLPSAT